MTRLIQLGFIFILAAFAAVSVSAQSSPPAPWPFPDSERRRDEESRFIKEMLAKQQSEREKKEYRAMLERGERALNIALDLEKSASTGRKLSADEQKRLDELAELIAKIRDDLGGDDDLDKEPLPKKLRPRGVREGFAALTKSTANLVDELKRSTRYSISIVAIETSNDLIKLARFLKLAN